MSGMIEEEEVVVSRESVGPRQVSGRVYFFLKR